MLVCPKCKASNAAAARFCESCGAPLDTLHEADDMIAGMLMREARKGVWALGIVAVIQGITIVATAQGDLVLWGVAGVFAVLAIWALRAPLLASSIGLGVFVLLHLLEAFVDPSSLLRGILMKIVIIGLLIAAIKGGLRHREFQQQRGRGA
jgi:hypothetical protein